MAHPDLLPPPFGSRDHRHATGGRLHFPVFNAATGETVYIVGKRIDAQGVEVLTDESGGKWIAAQRLGHVQPYEGSG